MERPTSFSPCIAVSMDGAWSMDLLWVSWVESAGSPTGLWVDVTGSSTSPWLDVVGSHTESWVDLVDSSSVGEDDS